MDFPLVLVGTSKGVKEARSDRKGEMIVERSTVTTSKNQMSVGGTAVRPRVATYLENFELYGGGSG